MIIVLILFLAASFIGIKKRRDKNIDYLNKRTTGSICGVCVILVFMSHFLTVVNSDFVLDVPATFLLQSVIGQFMVVPFLFFSGYGITFQYLSKKESYLKSFLIKRVLKVYLLYVICLLIKQFSNYLVNGCTVFIFNPIELVFPTYWYIFVITIEYIAIFLALLIFKDNKRAVLISNIVISIILTLSLYLGGKETWWYNTTIAFSFGIFWGLYRGRIDQILAHKKSYIILTITSLVTLCAAGGGAGALFIALENNKYLFYPYIILYFTIVIAFMLLILLFIYAFKYGNKCLYTISLYTLYVYILQKLSFEVFKDGVDVFSIHRYLYFLVCVVLTAAISFVVKLLYDFFWKHTFDQIKFDKTKQISG